jgi:hypothetical protein
MLAMYNINKPDGLGTWPEFEKEMNFYIILIEFEDCSDYATRIESRSLQYGETDFVSGNDYTASKTWTAFLCIGYDGTWAEISLGNSRQ